MAAAGERGSIVTLLCDGGDRYGCTYHDETWLADSGLAWQHADAEIAALLGQGG
jgi:cysteine synthase A